MMFWFVVILAIAFLLLGPKDHQLRCSAANVLAGAASHIDSSPSNDDETGVAAKAKIHKPKREYIQLS